MALGVTSLERGWRVPGAVEEVSSGSSGKGMCQGQKEWIWALEHRFSKCGPCPRGP